MGRYASSKFRIIVLGMMLGAAALVMFAPTQNLFAQATAAPAGAPGETSSQGEAAGIVRLILGNLDFVFFTIAALSIAGLTLIIQGFLKNRQSVFLPENTINMIREMIAQKRFKELIDFTETDPTFISAALNPALKRAPNFSHMKEAMETAIGEQTAEQFRKIEYLNIIGNLGPLLGLLGTVLGMIKAFQVVAATHGQADVGALSGGISTALTHTFLGLMLAVPCLAAFGILRTIVDRLTVRGAMVAEELLLMMKPSEAKPAAAAAMGQRAGAMPQPAMPTSPIQGARKPAAPIPAPQ
ncbi:MAG: MotA/TolQ/ExbB proton channel family protein [Anaerolineae bacterium]|nr:MotA/TolQ/ExbB proton channel family protein [Phycisphaerae bacterium]